MIPVGDAAFDRALGVGTLYARSERGAVLAEVLRVLKPGGALVLHEPLLAEGRRISEEVDLRSLGIDLARRVLEVEEEMYSDSSDPRLSLTPEALASLAEKAGFVQVSTERTTEVLRRKVTPEQVDRWLTQRREGRPTYAERLLGRISPEELGAYRRLLEESLIGRVLERPLPGVVCAGRKT